MLHRRSLSFVASVVALCAACGSTTTSIPEIVLLTGSYTGFESGTRGTTSFDEDPIQIFLVHDTDDDSFTGEWQTTAGSGQLTGQRDPQSAVFTYTMEWTQTAPCDGTFTSTGEARSGIRADGQLGVALAGEYSGMDCQEETDAEYFVEILR